MPKEKAAQDRAPADIQTLIFSKEKFKGKAEAIAWAKAHGFTMHKQPDETAESWRLRQENPGTFEPGSFRTIELRPGVKAVIGRRK